MITELLIAAFMEASWGLISLLPVVDFTIPDGAFNTLVSAMRSLGYLLPVSALLPIIAIKISLKGVRIVMALIVRIKSFIPTMGA